MVRDSSTVEKTVNRGGSHRYGNVEVLFGSDAGG